MTAGDTDSAGGSEDTSAPAVGEPLVEAVGEVVLAGEVAPARLLEPVDEVGLVGVTQQDLRPGLAVDDLCRPDLLDGLLAVYQIATVAGFAHQPRQPEDTLARLGRHVVQRPDRPVRGEHLVLVEPPAAHPDRYLSHGQR